MMMTTTMMTRKPAARGTAAIPGTGTSLDDVDAENFKGAGCCLYARIQITNYDNVIQSVSQWNA